MQSIPSIPGSLPVSISSTNSVARRTADEAFAQAEERLAQQQEYRAKWSRARTIAHKLVHTTAFEASMATLVMLNMAFLIVEVNNVAKDQPNPMWLSAANITIIVCYFLEVLLKLFVLHRAFFCDMLSLVDLIVITVDLVVTITMLIVPMSVAPVVLARVARVLKITRAFRMLAIFPEMNVLLKGIFFAMKTIVWGALLLAALLCFWSIFATLFIHPLVIELEKEGYWAKLECERCARAFSSVELSMLTFTQQLIVGEGWSDINTPLIERYPETAIFFVLVMISLTLAALNLLLGVIVERASDAKAMTVKELASRKDKERQNASDRLLSLCQDLDKDKNGSLTVEELKAGFQESQGFVDMMRAMDIEAGDIDVVYSLLDTDHSGAVDYKEFVNQLYMLRNQDSHTLLVFIKFYVMDIRSRVSQASAARRTRPSTPSSNDAACVSSMPASLDWPELEAELSKLTELRKEVLELSNGHMERLSRIQESIAVAAREPPAPPQQKCCDAGEDDEGGGAHASAPRTAPAAGKQAQRHGAPSLERAPRLPALSDLDPQDGLRTI